MQHSHKNILFRYPFGMAIPNRTYSNGTQYRYGFNGQEKSDELDNGLYTAQFWEYDSRIGRRWNRDPKTSIDESEYAVLGNSPIWMTDPLGDDWFKYKDNGDKKSSYHWQDGSTYKHKTGTDKNGKDVFEELKGFKAVVVFDGNRNEKLGKGDNVFGEGAVLANVTVYGPKGKDDIQQYKGLTMTSDFNTFGAIDNGEYTVNYRSPGKSGALSSNWAVNNTNPVNCLDGKNPSPIHPFSATQKDGVYIHRPNSNGWAGKTYNYSKDKSGKKVTTLKGGVTTGCLLIVPTQYDNKGNVKSIGWNEFNKQLGKTKEVHLELNRTQ